MQINDILKEHSKITESTESLFSIIIYDKSSKSIVDFFEDQLEKAKKIINPVKKNKVNNRLFNFIKYIRDNYDEDNEKIMINNIFLIHDKIVNYPLTNEDIKTARTYDIFNIFIKCDTFLYVDYFIDLFTNFNFIYSIKMNKNDLSLIKLNKNKSKEIESLKISNESKIIDMVDKIRNQYNYRDVVVIHGNSLFLNKINDTAMTLSKNIIINRDFLNNESIFSLYEDELMKKNHILLENKLNELKNDNCNTDLFVFGKLKFEIKEAIELYQLKELYIDEKKLENLKRIIDDESYFNFKIIPIKSLENGDLASFFLKDYNGIMGIKYYS